MPCWTVETIQVQFSPNTDPNLMEKALKETEGMVVRKGSYIRFGVAGEWIDCETGKSRFLNTERANRVKQAYSKQIVLSQAKRFGWNVKKVGSNKFMMQRG